MKKGFTLIELITVLSALGIFSTIVINIIKPIDIIKCSRDTQRINDLKSLSSAIANYLSETKNPDLDGPYFSNSGFDEATPTIFLSISKDKESTSSSIIIDGKNWRLIQPSSTFLISRINGEGWLPIDFLSLSKKPINVLPYDPVNTFRKNYFYSYAFKKSAKTFEINANFECKKFRELAKNDGGDSELFEVGTDLNIIPPLIYGYSKTQLSYPSIKVSGASLLSTSIGQSSSTIIYITNTGTAYLNVYQINQSNQNSFLKIDKTNFSLAPYNTTTLTLTCDGRALNSSTTTQTTLFIWHNDPKIINPYPYSFTCDFTSKGIIEINPKSAILTGKTIGEKVSSIVTIFNKGDYKISIYLGSLLYKETNTTCPNYIEAIITDSLIPPNSSVDLRFILSPTSTKQDFYCKQIINTDDPSYPTITVPVYIKITSPPKAPVIDNLFTDNGTITISWLKPEDDGGEEIIKYEIYRNNTSTLIATTSYNVLLYQDTNLNNGQIYCYWIRAVNKVGNSNFSQKRCIIPGSPPSSPVNFSAISGNKSIILSWQPPINNGGSIIDSYLLYYRKQGENNWRYLFDFPAYPTNSYSFTHQDLINGQTYEYTIRAKNQFGISDYATTIYATPKGYPLPPRNLQTTALSNGIRLNWNPPLSNEGSPIVFYKIYRATSSLSNFIFIASTTVPSYDDLSISSGTIYFYYVTAVNSIDEGKKSNIEEGCWGLLCVAYFRCISPSNLNFQSLANKIILSWSDSDSQAIYGIYESTGDEYFLIATTSNTLYLRTGLINGRKYSYYVTKLIGDLCGYESLPSNYVIGIPSSTPLSPLSLDSSESKANYTSLSWEPPFSDEGATITEYYIYKATSSPTSTYQLIATTSIPSYFDYDNSISTPIYYYVRAKNNNGLGFKSNIAGRYNSQCFGKIYFPNSKNNNFNDGLKINNGYLAVGWEYNYDTINYNAVLYQLDHLGNPKSIKIANTSNESSFNFIIPSSTYYVLGGQIKINGNYDGLLVKLATNASDTLWVKRIGAKKDEKILSGILDNNEIIITGYSSSFGQGDNDLIFAIFNDSGTMKTFKTFGGINNDVGQKVIKATDNGYLVIGYTNSFRKNYDILLVKFDNNGNLIWQKVYDSGGNDFGSSISSSTNGYIISGYSSFDSNNYDIFVISIDLEGNILWQKRYLAGGNDYIYNLKKDYDGNYVLIGKSNSYNNSNYDGLLIKINSTTGDIIFSKTLGWFNNDSFYNLDFSNNGYYFIIGNSNYWSQLGYNQLVINISSSSDYLLLVENKKSYYKFILNTLNYLISNSNLKIYFSNLKANSAKISVFNYDLNLVDKNSPDYERLFNVCNIAEIILKVVIYENNLNNKNHFIFSRSGSSNIYLSIDNFLSYLAYISFPKNIYRSANSDNYNSILSGVYNAATDTNPLVGNNCYRFSFPFSNFLNEFCSATTSDKLRPTPPVNFEIFTDPFLNYIGLIWNPPQYNGGENIQYYKIYRAISTNEINNFILIATTTATSYNDTSAIESINYCYYTTALNSIGESDKSLIKCGVRFSGPIGTISLSTNFTSDLGVKLNWNDVSNIDYYVIYREYIKIATTNATSYIDYNYDYSNKNQVIDYKVEAIKNNIRIASDGEIIAYFLKLPPRNLTSNLGNKSINLNWNPPLSETGLKYFSIYRKIKGSSYDDLPYATIPTSTLNFNDNNLLAGETYCYIIKANYPNGESLPSNEVCATILTLPQPSFSIRQTGIFGAWLVIDKIENYSPQAGFGKIKEFRIYKATSSNYQLLATTSPDNLNYIDLLGLVNSATYTISAVNEIGEGTATPVVNVNSNFKEAKFKYYEITTDNQIFEIGKDFSSTILGTRETLRKARNYAIYIEVEEPPKFINIVNINAYSDNLDKIKEYKFICDNKVFNLDKRGSNMLYNLNLICSKMFIILNWDSRLPEDQIPSMIINSITINQ